MLHLVLFHPLTLDPLQLLYIKLAVDERKVSLGGERCVVWGLSRLKHELQM